MSQCTAELNDEHCQREGNRGRALCSMHAWQKSKHGAIRSIKPTPGRLHLRLPAPERFAQKLKAGGHDGQCWEWTAGKTDDGYGVFHDQGKTYKAHRWAWMHLVNPALDCGIELDHICMNVSCVRPSHLQAVNRSKHAELSREQRSLLKANEDSILVGGNRKARGIQELSYAMEHGLPCVFDGAKIAR